MNKIIRKFFLDFARGIAKREGLTLADIRRINNTDYIVDNQGTFYTIGKPVPFKPKK